MKTLSVILLTAIAAIAQQPQIDNAKLETRAFSGLSLQAELSSLGAGPLWAGWSEPMIQNSPDQNRPDEMCWSDRRLGYARTVNAPVRLEGQTTLVVLVRIDGSKAPEIRVTSPDCRIDAGGLPFYWITGVPAGQSVDWLRSAISPSAPEQPILAIALHAGPAAAQALDQLTAPGQPSRIRERTAFWLSVSRGAEGLASLKRMLANDPDPHVREQVIFAISQSREPSAVPTLIDTARSDPNSELRKKALFWLSQKAASKQAVDALNAAVSSDPDSKVKEQAVFAIKQLPEDQGVPLLINLAKNNPDTAVRKRAIFWLGQSSDPRALDFIAQLLK